MNPDLNKQQTKKNKYTKFWNCCKEGKVKVTQLYLTLCDPMDYPWNSPGQNTRVGRVAFPFSRGSSQLRDRTQVSCIAGIFFASWAIREAQEYWSE